MGKRMDATDVNAYYGDFRAIQDVNLAIEPNDVTALIGPSGCGKSTFLRCLNRMHEAIPKARVEGKLLLDGEDVYARDVDVSSLRRDVGMVFQRPNPFPTMSVKDNVLAGLRLTGRLKKSEVPDIVESSLRSAGLWDEVKDRLDKPGPVSPAASSSACASPGLSQSSRMWCSWTSPARRSTRSRRS